MAIVTGAGSPGGIGFATALRLAGRGAHVVLVGTTDRVLERASELVADGRRATGVVADLRDEQAVDEAVSVAASLGAIEVLVNNAGMTSIGAGRDADRRIDQLTLAEWDDTMRRNLSTAFLMSRAVVPGMRRRRRGRIVNVASTTGPLAAFDRAGAYAAAKAGMAGLTRALAFEVASAGITVNAVAPGWIDTPSATAAERRAGRATPIGRSGTADEVAAVIEFLASPDASYVTGSLIVVDGGNSIAEDHAASSRLG